MDATNYAESGNGQGSFVSDEDTRWRAWVAACHGLKGEARGLGATALGEYFYQLELAGKFRDREKIQEIYPLAMEEWERVVDGIRTAMERTG